MLTTYLITVLIILGLLGAWITVQYLARAFAARHPELGPAREEGGGCSGLFCLCKGGKDCKREALLRSIERERATPPALPGAKGNIYRTNTNTIHRGVEK